jgi:hypothetical protein
MRRSAALLFGLSGLLLAGPFAGCGRYGKPERYPPPPPPESRLADHASGAEKRYTLESREATDPGPDGTPVAGRASR